MSWILQNKFVAILIAGTAVLSGLFLYLGTQASGRYQQYQEEFDQAAAQVASYERLALYPNQENLDGKNKALADYESSIDELKKTFSKFQRPEADRISPQEFGNRLIAVNQIITDRLQAANVSLPDAFYSGFESYTGTLAQSAATSVLNHQLNIVESLMSDLARARPAEITNFYRAVQPEEAGGLFEANSGEVVRPHAFELSFLGTEASARQFVTRLVDTRNRFAVIRNIRITNESTVAPKPAPNLFATRAAVQPGPAANPFAGGFFDAFSDPEEPDEDAADALDAAQDALPAVPAPPQPAGGIRKLGQVAGSELVRVFIRFDVMEVFPEPDANPSDES